jgi:hypothetical protein
VARRGAACAVRQVHAVVHHGRTRAVGHRGKVRQSRQVSLRPSMRMISRAGQAGAHTERTL